MADRDVINQKVNSIQNCLQRIHDTVGSNPDSLEELDVQDIVVLNLQRAIQQAIDIATHIISHDKLGIPQTLKECFQILQHNSYIDSKLASAMGKMVGFRNIAVHEYEAIDSDILKAIVQNHLGDLEAFYSAVLEKVK